MSTEYFICAIENIKNSKYAPATNEMYHTVWVSFNKFIIRLDKYHQLGRKDWHCFGMLNKRRKSSSNNHEL